MGICVYDDRMRKTTWVMIAMVLGAVSARANAECEVTVERAVTASGKSKGGIAEFGTDYWLTEKDMEKAITALVRLGKSGDDPAKRVAEAMKKDPKIYALIFNCQTGEADVSFVPANGSKYKDVPYGPKKYKVARGFKSKPGEMGALIMVKKEGWAASEGELDITKFDKSGVAGTFLVKAAPMGKKDAPGILIKGKFSYPCHTPGEYCSKK
jgi:hypothetical protein